VLTGIGLSALSFAGIAATKVAWQFFYTWAEVPRRRSLGNGNHPLLEE
jgi:hypothetical protein